MTIAQKLRTAQSGDSAQIKDMFSIDLYKGHTGVQGYHNLHKNLDFNDSRASIWFKGINNNTSWAVYSEALTNSQYHLNLNGDGAESQLTHDLLLNGSFPSSGTLGAKIRYNIPMISDLNYNYISYAFKNTDRFFKEITYTGTGAGHKLNYDLKDTLGMAVFRNIDSGGEWFVWHKNGGSYQSSGNYYWKLGFLNRDYTFEDSMNRFYGNTTSGQYGTVDTSAETFWLGPGAANNSNRINQSGQRHLAMFFAHNTSSNPDENFIKCDTFNLGSHNGMQVDLGFEPQFLMLKDRDSTNDWYIVDKFSGATSNQNNVQRGLKTNKNQSYWNGSGVILNGNGFYVRASSYLFGSSNTNKTIIYMAIKSDADVREEKPQRHFFGWTYRNATPSQANLQGVSPAFYKGNESTRLPSGSSGDVNMNPDNAIIYDTGATSGNGYFKMIASMKTSNQEYGLNSLYGSTPSPIYDVYNLSGPSWWTNGYGSSADYGTTQNTDIQAYLWKNLRGVADTQVYNPTINGSIPSTVTIKHNLGAVPEMMIFRKLGYSNQKIWIYHKDMLGPSETGVSKGHFFDQLNAPSAQSIGGQPWGSDGMSIGGYPTAPTETEIKLNGNVNTGGQDSLVDASDYIVWMFASKKTLCQVGIMHIQYGNTTYTSSLADFPHNGKKFFMYRKIGNNSTYDGSAAPWRIVSTDFEFDHNFFNHDKYFRPFDTLVSTTDENICSNTSNRVGVNPNIGNEGNGYYIYLAIAYTE